MLAAHPGPIDLVQGDLARQSDVDAVVNAANAELLAGGGVSGALHRAAGPGLEDACRPLAPVPVGQWGTLHTVRDGSQHLFPRIGVVIQGDSERALEVAAFQSNLTVSEIANRI